MNNIIPETKLPNGMKVFCLRKKEVPILYEQIQEYIKYGIQLNKDDIIFDVGANIGLFTLWAYQQCQGNIQAYAFEPIPNIFKVLEANSQRLNPEKIKVFPFGLSQESKSTTFAYHPYATMLSSVYLEDTSEIKNQLTKSLIKNFKYLPKSVSWIHWIPSFLRSLLIKYEIEKQFQIQQVTCQLKTVSEIIQENNIKQIDLLKIDVEKSELDVLLGIEAQDWQKIKQIVVEVHDLQDKLQKIKTLLQQNSFNKIIVEQEPLFNGSNIVNLYAWRQ